MPLGLASNHIKTCVTGRHDEETEHQYTLEAAAYKPPPLEDHGGRHLRHQVAVETNESSLQ